jgi:hypothetical protein
MSPNNDQSKKFARFAKNLNMEVNDYVACYSKEYIGKLVKNISEISEEEAEKWIRKAKNKPANLKA